MDELRSVDLNLMVSLDALLREQSVTNAARTLGLSQPTLSASLARLRRHFGDPLLVREGNRLVLSSFAQRLQPQVDLAVAESAKVFSRRVEFEPASCRREFRVVASDYGGVLNVAPWSRDLTAVAPASVVRAVHPDPEFVAGAPESLRKVDAMILPHGVVSNLPHRDLHEDRWVCVADAANPHIDGSVTLENLATLPWVLPFDASSAFAPIVNQLRGRNVSIRAQVITQTFSTIPALVAGSERVALLQERLARQVADLWRLQVLEIPVETAPLVQALWWHPTHEHDAEHRWFRELAPRLQDEPEPST